MNLFWKRVSAHYRKVALLALLASVLVFATGLTRFLDYSLPMLQGDYATAANAKELPNDLLDDPTRPPLDIFAPSRPEDEVSLWLARRAHKYVDFAAGNRVEAAFNHGWQRYEEHDYKGALQSFQKAYTVLCGRQGAVDPSDRKEASRLQLLIGNCYCNLNQSDEGYAAYEMALRLDPDNILATYNLERLQNAQGGKGKTDDDGQNPRPGGVNRGQRI